MTPGAMCPGSGGFWQDAGVVPGEVQDLGDLEHFK